MNKSSRQHFYLALFKARNYQYVLITLPLAWNTKSLELGPVPIQRQFWIGTGPNSSGLVFQARGRVIETYW